MKTVVFGVASLVLSGLDIAYCFTGSGGGRLLRAPNRRSISLASSVPVAPTEDAGVVSLDPFAANESPAIELPSSVLSNSALVAGNMIGAGVLALPQVTSAPGFLLSSAAMVLVWGYCVASGLIVAECAGGGRESIQEMAEASIGRTAGNAMCATFLASNYLLLIAYICQGSSLISGLPIFPPTWCPPLLTQCIADFHLAPLAFTAVVGCASLWGPARLVENVNTALVGVVGLSFMGLLGMGIPHVDVPSLGLTPDSSALPGMLPVAVCALTFQNVVPAVSKNLGGDKMKIRSSLAIGSGVPLCIYILWNAVVLGNAGFLNTGAGADLSPMDSLAASSPVLGLLVGIFSMAAIITSFWGAAFSLMIECTHLVDAFVTSGSLLDTKGQFPLADDADSIGEVARHDGIVKTAAASLVLVPPALVSMACPDSFLSALQYTGVYVDPFLYGLVPAVMAYRLRDGVNHSQQMPGGSMALFGVATATAGFMIWQTLLSTV